MSLAARLLATACFLAVWCVPTLARAAGDGIVRGGPCTYDAFPGQATIVSVVPWQPDSPMAGIPTPYPPLAVTYTFAPDAPIVGEPLYKPGLVHAFTLLNGMPPGSRFVEKYGIAPGKVFPCELRIIRQGTCTPALYVFPGIDQTDYFELTRP